MPDIPFSDEERRLLAAAAADPEDDAPRLAYADLVSGRDPELAEFIRLSIDYARNRLSTDWSDPTWKWHRELKEWFIKRVCDEGAIEAGVERGFVRWITLPSDIALDRAAAIFEGNPLIRTLIIQAGKTHSESLATLPYLSRLEGLRVSRKADGAPIGDDWLAGLVASPSLTSLKGISLDGVSLGPTAARAIAQSQGIEHLSLSNVGSFDQPAAAALADEPRFRLQTLQVEKGGLRAEGCAALAAGQLLAGVTSLTLTGNWIGDEGAQGLARAPLGACTKLVLKECGIGDGGAAALAGSPVFEVLEELDLYKNHVGNEGATAFARTPYLPMLRRLDLQYNAIGEPGAEALAETERLPSLQVLGLSGNSLYTDEIEEWTDWNGTPVGSGPRPMPFWEIKGRYERRFKLE